MALEIPVMENQVVDIAREAHEINRAYCQYLGDNTQIPWEKAPEWQKQSCINGVCNVIKNPNTTPEQSHLSWLKEKEEAGWTYGEIKDVENKKHPCMVPYDQLPQEQRMKDLLFIVTVRRFLNLLLSISTRDAYLYVEMEKPE